MRRFKWIAVLAAIMALAGIVAACGSSSKSSSSTGGTTPSASAAGSGTVSPGTHTIGVLPSTASSEFLAVQISELKQAIAPFGWKVDVCDPAGVVTKMEACMESFVTQKVSAIVTMALGGPEIPTGFKEAHAAKIPVLALVTSVQPGYAQNWNGIFADGIPGMGAATAKYIAAHRRSIPIVGNEITQNYGGQGYIIGLVAQLKKEGLKITLKDTDLANLVSSYTANAQALLAADSGPLTFIDFSDFGAPLVMPLLTRAHRTNVTIITRYDDPTTVKLMRTGAPILVQVTKNYEHMFDMITALAAYFTKGTPFPPNSKTVYEPGATVASIKQFAPGATQFYPFAPALKKQVTIWAKTYKLSS